MKVDGKEKPKKPKLVALCSQFVGMKQQHHSYYFDLLLYLFLFPL